VNLVILTDVGVIDTQFEVLEATRVPLVFFERPGALLMDVDFLDQNISTRVLGGVLVRSNLKLPRRRGGLVGVVKQSGRFPKIGDSLSGTQSTVGKTWRTENEYQYQSKDRPAHGVLFVGKRLRPAPCTSGRSDAYGAEPDGMLKLFRTLPLGCLVVTVWLGLGGAARADSWFTPSTTWLAQRMRTAGFQMVKNNTVAVGGIWTAEKPGPIVVLSSNDPTATIGVLKAMSRPEKGSVLLVFGPDIKLDRGDFLIKLDYTDELAKDEVALPTSGPSIDTFELIISDGNIPKLAIASDLVLTLQNRARTASELVVVQLEHFRPLDDGTLAVDLSLRVFDPTLRDAAAKAVAELSEERLSVYESRLLSLQREAAKDSGQWPGIREALGPRIRVVQETPPVTPLFTEDFGRPQMPAITLRVGSSDRVSSEALANVLSLVLNFER
jgi:hypothetical protein